MMRLMRTTQDTELGTPGLAYLSASRKNISYAMNEKLKFIPNIIDYSQCSWHHRSKFLACIKSFKSKSQVL